MNQETQQLHEQGQPELASPMLDEAAGISADALQQFEEDSEGSDDNSRSNKRATQPNSDKNRAKRPRTRSELMQVAQQLVAAYLPMTSRVANGSADGSIASLFDLSALPFAISHSNFQQQQHPGVFPGATAATGSTAAAIASAPASLGSASGIAVVGSGVRPLLGLGQLPAVGAGATALGMDAGQVAAAGGASPEENADDKKHECELCGKRYKHRTHLTRHMRTHSGDKPFACSMCGKGFARREYLSMHMHVHQGEATADVKFLQCEHCDKKFTRQQVLDKHMEFHSPARRFACQTCGLRFKTGPGLAAHVAAHTPNRPYVCNICSKGFKSSTALKAHEVVHTGERKFACTECNKAFNNLSSLHKHALVHNEQNPYKCEVCHQTFKYSSNFTRHLRQHLQTTTS